MRRFLFGTLLFGVLSVIPATVRAQDADHDRVEHPAKVYYDRAHKDKHEWNAAEDTAWARYREDHRVTERDFAKYDRRRQQDYWKWRHDHPDSH